MSVTVYVSPEQKGRNYWEDIHYITEAQRLIRNLGNRELYQWIKEEDRGWINDYFEKLLVFLVDIKISECGFHFYPYKKLIIIRVDGFDAIHKETSKIHISYDENENPKDILVRIVQGVFNDWKNRLKGPLSVAERVFTDCKKYGIKEENPGKEITGLLKKIA